jgi:hypothetical protein
LAAVYVIRLDDLARDYHARTTAAALAQMQGVQVDVPGWDDIIDRFDTELAAPLDGELRTFEPGSDTRTIRLRALGLQQ